MKSQLSAARTWVIAIAIGLVAGGLLAPAAAFADAGPSPDWGPLRSFYNQYGVSPVVQNDLIAKLQSGGSLDSSKADRLTPVATRSFVAASSTVTVETFADGSILVSSVQSPVSTTMAAHPDTISGCTNSTGSGYHNASHCSITQGDGTYSIGFKASYTQYPGGAQITAYYSPYATALYGSVTAPTLTLVRSAQIGTQPAQVTEHTHFTSTVGTSSEDFYLSLRVLSTSATTTPY